MQLLRRLKNIHSSHGCCNTTSCPDSNTKKLILVGSPNVGKSVLFNQLTNSYTTVSNYPGTTVTLTKGITKIGNVQYEVIDTPGIYSLLSITEEEKVTRSLVLSSENSIIIHIIDAKNIERMLPLTLQLIEAQRPVILVLNMMDEAEKLNLSFKTESLEEMIGIPVVQATGIKNKGTNKLKKIVALNRGVQTSVSINIHYGDYLESRLKILETFISRDHQRQIRAHSLLALQDVKYYSDVNVRKMTEEFINEIKNAFNYPPAYIIALARQAKATEITTRVLSALKTESLTSFSDKLNTLMITPITGVPILLLFLYAGLYKFVGELGAGIMVDFIEGNIFENHLNPFFTSFIGSFIQWRIIQDLFVGDYGIITLGIRYAIAIILPIVSTFFLVFALIEDSGYLPRLAMLIDKIFKKIGLSGRAVIPIILGLGCSTMATMVTRTLPTKRERIMATMLLALAIPCSAQLGVLFSLLASHPNAMLLWGTVISILFLVVGFLGAKLLPGNPPLFFMEVPPLRLPSLSNVLTKTYSRVVWYFKEVFPLFLVASILLWFGQLSGILSALVGSLSLPMKLLGLPEKTAVAYIFGFFRRDYGAAGLYDMDKAGLLTLNQLTIAIIAMTLFPACIAQALMMVKERGFRAGISIFGFCIVVAFSVGVMLQISFTVFKITL